MNIPKIGSYRKRIGRFAGLNVKHDQSTIAYNVSPECYNFDFSSGALRGGYGVTYSEFVPDDARRYWIYKRYSADLDRVIEEYVYQEKYGMLRQWYEKKGKLLYITGNIYSIIDALNYRVGNEDVLLLSCEDHKLITWNGKELVEHENSPAVSSMALHYERLFVTGRDEPTKVYFSDDLDPTNWNISSDGAGFVELLDERGDMNKLVSFGSYLYVFRDHGISRITAYGDQREFAVVNMFVTAGRIYPSSIVTCGTLIMFLASDGLYAFDGYDCKRVLRNLDGLIVPDDRCACEYFDGKYFLACTMDFRDGKKVGCETGEYTVNGLLVYDPVSGECSVTRGLNISYLQSCTYHGVDYLMCCENNHGGMIARCGSRFDEPLPKHWQSPLSDFGAPDKTKIVREVYVDTDVPCTVAASSAKKRKRLKATAGKKRLRFNFGAKSVALEIDTDADDCNIRPPTVIYSQY